MSPLSHGEQWPGYRVKVVVYWFIIVYFNPPQVKLVLEFIEVSFEYVRGCGDVRMWNIGCIYVVKVVFIHFKLDIK